MSRYRYGLPLALRFSEAAFMLSVSENQLRHWVDEGKIHKPFRIHKNVVRFDAIMLANDWDRMKEEAEAEHAAKNFEEKPNPWDEVLR